MKLIHDATSRLLHLLLLAELFVHSSPQPTRSSSLCDAFRSMIYQVERLMTLCEELHGLSDKELQNFDNVAQRLDQLPHIQHSAAYFHSLKVNESLSHLYVYTQSFRLHVDWLKTAKENVSLSHASAERAGAHLLTLSDLFNLTLHKISEEVPQTPSPSLPAVTTAFDVLRSSVEISQRLQVFCNWSKRVLRYLQRLSRCPRH